MKRMLAFILTFAMLCSVIGIFAGCGNQKTEKNDTPSTTIGADGNGETDLKDPIASENPTDPAITEPAPTEPTASAFVEVRDASLTFQNNTQYMMIGEPTCRHIPEVVFRGTVLPAVNGQIKEELQALAENDLLLNMTYAWWENGDILSILVELNWYFDAETTYVVFNIDPEQDVLLMQKDFCAAMGVSYEDCMAQLTGFLQTYCNNYSTGNVAYNWVVAETMSQENIENSVPFLGPDGNIWYSTRCADGNTSGWISTIYMSDGKTYDPDEKQTHLSCSPDPIKPGVDVQNGQNVLVRDASVRFQTNKESILPGTPNCFHIPEVVVNGSVLSNVSNYIANELEEQTDGWLLNMTYYWWYKGDVLSLLVELNWAYNDDTTYFVYNISLSKGTFLTQQEFCTAMGISYEECKKQLTGFLQTYCDKHPTGDSMYEYVITKTMDPENINESTPFLGPDGYIYYSTHVAGIGASGWHSRIYISTGKTYDPDEKKEHYDGAHNTVTPTKPDPANRGNKVGDYCYGRELLIFNENGLTGEKIDPTTTGKPTIIHFYYYDYSTMFRLKMNYSDSFHVIMVNGNEYRDSHRQEIADRMPNAPFIFTCETVDGNDANSYQKQLNAHIVILNSDGVITYTWNEYDDHNYPLYETLRAEIEKAGAVPDYPTYDFANSSVGTVAVNDIYYRKTEHNGSYYKYCTCCHVPAITVDGKPLTRVNQYISYNYLQAAIDEGGTETVSITYQYWQKGDLLSMLFRKHTESSDTIRYHAINISLSQDRILPDNQFYAAAGFDQTEAEASVVSMLKKYSDNFTWFDESQIGWVKKDTMTDYNIQRSEPFLSGNSLCFIVWKAVPAGSGWLQNLCYADGSDYSYSISDHKNCQ